MNIVEKDPETGNLIVFGTTRAKLRNYYKFNFAYNTLDDRFNAIAPEIKGKQIFSSSVAGKIIEELGLSYSEIKEAVLI